MAENIISQEKLLGSIDRIIQKKSIAARISEKQPMSGPLGIVLGTQRDTVNDKLIIRRKEIIPETEQIKTEFTEETLQDMFNIYGEDIYDVLAYYLVDELAYKIDEKFITMLKDRAGLFGTMVYNHADYKHSLYAVGQSIGMAIVKGLADLPISDNRHPEGFAIVSPDVAAVLALSTTLGDPNQTPNEDDSSPSYMGTLAGVDYYIDYTHDGSSTNNVVFGIKGNGISRGTAVLSHYTQEWVSTTNSETGEKNFFLFDRTGMTINPLDDIYIDNGESSAFCGKLNIDITNLASDFGYTGRP
jgi:hypothetical protein